MISEIQTLALQVKEHPPARADFFEVEELPEIWTGILPPEEVLFGRSEAMKQVRRRAAKITASSKCASKVELPRKSM